MTDKDRTRLAEAMGYKLCRTHGLQGQQYWSIPGGGGTTELPDPFTDANADYAVLEWMRDKFGEPSIGFAEFADYLALAESYRVGDYARAALAVLDDD